MAYTWHRCCYHLMNMHFDTRYYLIVLLCLLVFIPIADRGLCEGEKTKSNESQTAQNKAEKNFKPSGNTPAQASTGMTVRVTAPVTNMVTSPVIGETEEYRNLEKHIEELTHLPVKIRVENKWDKRHSPSYCLGKLQELERKAFECNALRVEIDNRKATISDLLNVLKEAQAVIDKQKKEIARLNEAANTLHGKIAQLQKEQEMLKESLNLLRLGNYEYYEIKQGDTCKSIAANPAIYGDETKVQYIRQANRGNVADLDSLVPGQMLIIPRFPASGKYEL